MQKPETKTLTVKEMIYYCDACNKRVGNKDSLLSGEGTQLFVGSINLVLGSTFKSVDRSYLLCDECYQAFHKYLTTEKSDKKGLSVLLSEES